MSKKPYPHFESEKQELAWLNQVGSGVGEHMSDPTAEDQEEFKRFLAERPDEEATRKPVTVRMKLRDLARLKGLARKLDTKYQTLMMELIAEGLDRLETQIEQEARPGLETAANRLPGPGGDKGDNVVEMVQHLSATRALIDVLLEAQGSKLSELMEAAGRAPAAPKKRAKKA